MTRQQKADWKAGADAQAAGTPYADCPHRSGERRIQWQEGWMQAKADADCDA